MSNVVNKICISKFFSEVLGAPLTNIRNEWGGTNDKFVFLRGWTDERNGNLVLISNHEVKSKPGFKNRTKHIEEIVAGKVGYLVMCVNGNDADNDTRKIKEWNKNEMLPILKVIYDDNSKKIYAEVGEPVPTVKLIDESGAKILADLNRPAPRKARRGIGSY